MSKSVPDDLYPYTVEYKYSSFDEMKKNPEAMRKLLNGIEAMFELANRQPETKRLI